MLLRANVLAKGFSGVRPETPRPAGRDAQRAASIRSCPCQGSVGASGDLAPLAHLALALDRRRPVRCSTGRAQPSGDGAARGRPRAGRARGQGRPGPHQRHAAHDRGRRASPWPRPGGSRAPPTSRARSPSTPSRAPTSAFDPRIHAARPHPGQAASARNLRALLAGSAIRESHRDCGKVQDAYSLRCMPQVHGAVRDALDYVDAHGRASR